MNLRVHKMLISEKNTEEISYQQARVILRKLVIENKIIDMSVTSGSS